jgi:hypothetical protein
LNYFWWSCGQNHNRCLDNPHTFSSVCKKCCIFTKKGMYRCKVMFIMFCFRWARQWCLVPCKLNYFWWSYGQNHDRFLDNPLTVPPACQKCCISAKKWMYRCEVMFFMFFFLWSGQWCPFPCKLNYFWWSSGQNHGRFNDNPHILFSP